MTDDHKPLTLYVYEVEPTHADGRGTSGWKVTVATDKLDLSDLARIVRVAIADRMGDEAAADWVGIKEVKLLTTVVLDPRIAA